MLGWREAREFDEHGNRTLFGIWLFIERRILPFWRETLLALAFILLMAIHDYAFAVGLLVVVAVSVWAHGWKARDELAAAVHSYLPWVAGRRARRMKRLRETCATVLYETGVLDERRPVPYEVERVRVTTEGLRVRYYIPHSSVDLPVMERMAAAACAVFEVPEATVEQFAPARYEVAWWTAGRPDPLVDVRSAGSAADRLDGFAVTVGRFEDGTDTVLDLAEPTHVALQGQTRSGKSVLTYGVLGALATHPAVEIAGVDPSGILLSPFAGSERVAVGTADMQAAAEVLSAVVAEMDRRIEALRAHRREKLGATDFTADQPLLVVVLEELPAIVTAAEAEDKREARKPAERCAPVISACMSRLLAEGAKVGARCVLMAQRLDASLVGGAARANISSRMTLRMESPEGVRMLHAVDAATADAARAFAPGVGLVDLPGAPYPRRFRTDLADYQTFLAEVSDRDPPDRFAP